MTTDMWVLVVCVLACVFCYGRGYRQGLRDANFINGLQATPSDQQGSEEA